MRRSDERVDFKKFHFFKIWSASYLVSPLVINLWRADNTTNSGNYDFGLPGVQLTSSRLLLGFNINHRSHAFENEFVQIKR